MDWSTTDSLTFRVVYDVRHAMPNAWGLIIIPLVLGPVGYGIYKQARRFESSKTGFVGLFLVFMAGLVALFVIGGSLLPYLGLRSHVTRGAYRVIEGTVRSFVAGDAGDHRSESWVLQSSSDSIRYSYSPSIIDAGYDQTVPHGGQVREGVRLRVWDVGGRIARLEIAQ
jgi:hypothetical protein